MRLIGNENFHKNKMIRKKIDGKGFHGGIGRRGRLKIYYLTRYASSILAESISFEVYFSIHGRIVEASLPLRVNFSVYRLLIFYIFEIK